jgi:hypothetical protein
MSNTTLEGRILALQSFERLLSAQIEAGDNPAVLVKKRAAVHEKILDAEAAIARQQILEAIV